MKIFKTLSKRGLALFLVLTMCFSFLPAAALAAEMAEATHAHNEDGWTCAEESELICGYEDEYTHDETCWETSKASDEPVCGLDEAEDHEHTDECYVWETVLVCDLEEHEHGDGCYKSVWTCTEPTAEVSRFLRAVKAIPEEITAEDEDVIADARSAYDALTAEETANLSVVKAYEVLKNAEAALETAKEETPAPDEGNDEEPAEAPAEEPVEEPEEIPAEVQAFLDAVAAIRPQLDKEDLMLAETRIAKAETAYAALSPECTEREDVLDAVNQLNTAKADAAELGERLVAAFLDAVDQIPDPITEENLEEAMEIVYVTCADAQEALLSTSYEDREDVQEAVAVMVAAIEEINYVGEYGSRVYADVIRKGIPIAGQWSSGIISYYTYSIFDGTYDGIYATHSNLKSQHGLAIARKLQVTLYDTDGTPLIIADSEENGKNDRNIFNYPDHISCSASNYWFEIWGDGKFGDDPHNNYNDQDELQVTTNGHLGKVQLHIKRYPRLTYDSSEYCTVLQRSVLSDGHEDRSIRVYADNKEVGSWTGTFQNRYSARAADISISKYNSAKYALRGDVPNGGDTVTVSGKTYNVYLVSKYAVNYNANGGSGAPGAQTKYHGVNLTLSGAVPTRAGYTFAGWNTKADGTGTSYAAGATYTGNAELTLYAQWTGSVVRFYVKGTGTPSYELFGVTGSPENKQRLGVDGNYIIIGTAPDYGVVKDVTSIPLKEEKDKASTEQWLEANNITTPSIADVKAAVNNAKQNNVWGNASIDFDENGYNAISVTSMVRTPDGYHIHMKLSAKAIPVTYHANNGTDAVKEDSWTYNAAGYTVASGSQGFSMDGHQFGGWYTEAACTQPAETPIHTTKAVDLYAKWTPKNDIQVTYNYQGATGGITDAGKTVTYGQQYDTLPAPTKTGYAFAGWYTAATGGSKVEATTTVTNAADHTLYAHWTANTYAVIYNANGGDDDSVPVDSETHLAGSEVTLDSTTTPTHADADGKKVVFIGWTAAKIPQIYAKGDTDPETTTEVTMSGNQTVYAAWGYDTNGNDTPDVKETLYTVTYTDGVDGEEIFANQVYHALSGETTPTFEGTPTRSGYVFVGWTPAVADTVTGNAVYVATWETDILKDPTQPEYPDNPEGDGIPDKYQVTVNYVSANPAQGAVTGTTTKVFTLVAAAGGNARTMTLSAAPNYATSGTIVPGTAGVILTPATGYAFDRWNTDPNAELSVEGGKTCVYTARFLADTIGPGGNGDGIPDIYQAVVTYVVEYGTWEDTDTANQTAVFTLYEKTGNVWSAMNPAPTLGSTIPTGMIPNVGRTAIGSGWNEDITAETAVTGNVIYTYTFPVAPANIPTPGGTTIPGGTTPLAPAGTTINDNDVPLAAPGLNSTDHFDYIKGYADGTVRPEASITRAEVATIFFRLMTNDFRTANWATENDFSDVQSSDWYNNAVSTCAKAGILKGYSDGTFKPNNPITRAEFASIAASFASEEVASGGMFSDIEGHWAQTSIERAAAAGWIKGSDGKFRPNDQITRAEVIVTVNRMLDRVPDAAHLLDDMKTFSDNTPDKWYYADIQEATNSHDYERAEDGVTGIWIELLPEQDWTALEKEWATAADANVVDVAGELLGEDEKAEDDTTDDTDGDGDE